MDFLLFLMLDAIRYRWCPIKAGVGDLPIENKVLSIGDRAPDFTLTDAVSGEQVSLGDLLGQPLFLSFGRGTW